MKGMATQLGLCALCVFLRSYREVCIRVSYHLCLTSNKFVSRRDDAVLELATVCADLDAMQATLADSAVYVR